MRLIGYARVSTLEQNESLQVDELEKAGCVRPYVDHASGAKASRPALDEMVASLKDGDVVVVWKLDRLGRSLKNLIDLVDLFKSKGVGFRSLTEGFDTTTPQGELFFQLFGAFAQYERAMVRERTMAGLAAARARGRKGGRPSALSPKQVESARKMYDGKELSVAEIASRLGVHRTTVYRVLQERS
jgi:DNA invertase Pin-like site-specific DNA recombinase